MDRHHDGRNAIVRHVANAACVAKRITQKVTHALMRDATELLEQSKLNPRLNRKYGRSSWEIVWGIVKVK